MQKNRRLHIQRLDKYYTLYPKNRKELLQIDKTTNMLIEKKWVREVNKQFTEEQINWPIDLRKMLKFISSQGNESMNIDCWQKKSEKKKNLLLLIEVRGKKDSLTLEVWFFPP